MAWIGYQTGMASPVIRMAKERLYKYSYGKHLDRSIYFGSDLQVALMIYQSRKNVEFGIIGKPLLRTDGVLDYATQDALGMVEKLKPWLFTVHGTAQPDPTGAGLPADTARDVLDLYEWQPIGNYSAKAFPMWPSIMEGYEELVKQLLDKLARDDRPFAMAGYSQGAMVVALVLKREILDPKGRLHKYLSRLSKVVFWGNPMRQLGIQHDDEWIHEVAPADTAGIHHERLEGLENYHFEVRDYAHKADMYASCGFDDKSEHKRSIEKIVMGKDWYRGEDNILEQLREITLRPLPESIAVFGALIDTVKFFTNSAHAYNRFPAVRFLREI